METNFQQEEILQQTFAEVQQRFSRVIDRAHGWEHVNRVYTLALHIAREEHADRFIVGMAALMHDLGHTEAQHGDDHHADLSVAMARDLMQRYSVPAQQQEAILHAIIAHSFSKGIEARSLEARVVRDADRLDALGAIGIIRWAIVGTLRSNEQTLTYHPDDPFAHQREPDDKRYLLDHFYRKLFKLSDTMSTATGRALAEQRTAFMRAFLAELQNEIF
jgi:uncharacterized protein